MSRKRTIAISHFQSHVPFPAVILVGFHNYLFRRKDKMRDTATRSLLPGQQSQDCRHPPKNNNSRTQKEIPYHIRGEVKGKGKGRKRSAQGSAKISGAHISRIPR